MKLINASTSLIEQIDKVNEEVNEFTYAVEHEDNEDIISEFYDVIQSMLTTLDILDITNLLEQGKKKHEEKLISRNWILREIEK